MQTVFDILGKAPKINIDRLIQNDDWVGVLIIGAAATMLLVVFLVAVIIFRKMRGR